MDEFAVYTSTLSAAQVLAHYQNGTNAARATPYATLIKADGAAEYLRLDQPANDIETNKGTFGSAATGVYSYTINGVAGQPAPGFPGFPLPNLDMDFNGTNSYVDLANPVVLNFSNQITLEAWILLDTNVISDVNGEDVIAHGDDGETPDSAVTLELDQIYNGAGTAWYQVGSVVAGTPTAAMYTIPAADLSGSNWVYLVGTYDGTNWNIYRNGVLAASQAGVGSIAIPDADWAIGVQGRHAHQAGYPFTGQARQFSGEMDNVAIYNYALSPAQVAAHYSVATNGIV
jgi:hypothetical protein